MTLKLVFVWIFRLDKMFHVKLLVFLSSICAFCVLVVFLCVLSVFLVYFLKEVRVFTKNTQIAV